MDIENRLSKLELKIEAETDRSITKMQGSITEMQGSITEMQGSITEMQGSITEMQGSITGLEKRVLKLELTLENETNRVLNIIMESVAGIHQKLDNNQELVERVEVLEAKVHSLEIVNRRQ